MILVVMLVALTGCKKTDNTTSPEEAVAEKPVMGVYDSRALALAYWQQNVAGKLRMHRHEDLGLEAIDLGVLMHQQVFSHHEPAQALKYIADKLPEVMKQAGFDVLVSKWDKEELAKYNAAGSGWDDNFAAKNPNVVDVTVRIVQIINPAMTQEEYDKGFGKSKPEPFDTDWKNVKE